MLAGKIELGLINSWLDHYAEMLVFNVIEMHAILSFTILTIIGF